LLVARLAEDEHFELDRCSVPALVLYGEHDVYANEGQRILATTIEHARFITYPAAGHALHWDQPEHFVDDLHTFLA
jgi:pimeloyl-ACP methyl ester carboxylesterase